MSKNDKTIRYSVFNHKVFIVWKSAYKLGIPIIDEQHRGIVTAINSLYFGMQNKHGDDMLKPVIGMIRDYTHVHFQVEEDFLKRYKYPNLKQHIKLHKELIRELSRVGKKSVWDHDPLEFLEFLKKWWIDHINKEDQEYLDYLMAALRR